MKNLQSKAAIIAGVFLLVMVAAVLGSSSALWHLGIIQGQWARDYHIALSGIGGLEIGDGTMILIVSLALHYFKREGVAGTMKVLAGAIVAFVFVPGVGIQIAVWLKEVGLPEIYLLCFSFLLFLLLAWMAWQGAQGVEEDNAWTRLVGQLQERIQRYGACLETGVLVFLLEIPDKTGIGTAGLQLTGLVQSANWIGGSIALVLTNAVAISVVLLVGGFKESWVRWFGYVGAAGFFLGAMYIGWKIVT